MSPRVALTVDNAATRRRLMFARLARALTLAGFAYAVIFWAATALMSYQGDAYAYWSAHGDYSVRITTAGAFGYSPAFAQAISPLTALPWPTFYAAWVALELVVLRIAVGPLLLLPALLLPPIVGEMQSGNIHVLIALCAVVGARWPVAWALPLLTKVTPGIGLLWFVGRRDARGLAVAVVSTLAIVVVSWMLGGDWLGWIRYLNESRAVTAPSAAVVLEVGLPIRLTLAAGLALVAGAKNARPLLVVAVWLALPFVWFASLSMLGVAAASYLTRRADHAEAERRVVRERPVAPQSLEAHGSVPHEGRPEVVGG